MTPVFKHKHADPGKDPKWEAFGSPLETSFKVHAFEIVLFCMGSSSR